MSLVTKLTEMVTTITSRTTTMTVKDPLNQIKQKFAYQHYHHQYIKTKQYNGTIVLFGTCYIANTIFVLFSGFVRAVHITDRLAT